MAVPDVTAISGYIGGFAAASGFGLALAGRIARFLGEPIRTLVSSTAKMEVHSANTARLLEQVLQSQQDVVRQVAVFAAVTAQQHTVPVAPIIKQGESAWQTQTTSG